MFRLLLTLIIIFNINSWILWKMCNLVDNNFLIKKEIIFSLKPGTGRVALEKQLCQEKVIHCPLLFHWILRINPKLANFKAGTYRFTPGMNTYELLRLISSGKEAQFSIQLAEGMRLSDFLRKIRNAPHIKHTLNNDHYETVAAALRLENYNYIEGWFWPDTWMYTDNTSDIMLLKRAHQKMINTVEQIWKDRSKGLPYKNKNQLVTMASIIEKETALPGERDLVASVFINRLYANMRLQADPTVIYGMGYNYNGKISRKDLETLTKYNTYLINGLPPSPIAIPGKASLEAAAHPKQTTYLYFVADGNGGHIFSTNLIDHNRSVLKYLKINKKKNA